MNTFEENKFAVFFWGWKFCQFVPNLSSSKVSEMKSDNTKHSMTEGQDGENSTKWVRGG